MLILNYYLMMPRSPRYIMAIIQLFPWKPSSIAILQIVKKSLYGFSPSTIYCGLNSPQTFSLNQHHMVSTNAMIRIPSKTRFWLAFVYLLVCLAVNSWKGLFLCRYLDISINTSVFLSQTSLCEKMRFFI